MNLTFRLIYSTLFFHSNIHSALLFYERSLHYSITVIILKMNMNQSGFEREKLSACCNE